jgi:hypothetical protein
VGDKQSTLEEGKHYVPTEGKQLTLGEDKIVVLEDPRFDLGHPDKVFQNIIQKEHDLVLLLVGYGMMALLDNIDETYHVGMVLGVLNGFQ